MHFSGTGYGGWEFHVYVYASMKTMRKGFARHCESPPTGLCSAGAVFGCYRKGEKRFDLYFARDNMTYEAISHECYHAVQQMARERKRMRQAYAEEWQATAHGKLVNFVIYNMRFYGVTIREEFT